MPRARALHHAPTPEELEKAAPPRPERPASSMRARLVAEFLGTFVFAFCVGCTALSTNLWRGVTIASGLAASTYAMQGVSGAHFNPAISFAAGISKALGGPGIEWRTVLMYCAVQSLAAALAGLCHGGLLGASYDLAPGAGFSYFHVGLCEIIYTAMLVFIALCVTLGSKNAPNHFYGLAIGFVYVAGTYGAAQVSGGYFNPAVAVGLDLGSLCSSLKMSSLTVSFGRSFAYMPFELVGAILAVGLFRVVRPEDFGDAAASQQASRSAQLVCEFVGTFLLMLTFGLNVLGKSSSVFFSTSASYMCMIYAVRDISGAHFNPSVTLAIYLSGRCPEKTHQRTNSKACLYLATQLVAAVAGAFTYSSIYGEGSFRLGPGFFGEVWHPIAAAEFLFSLLLCYVVLCVSVSSTSSNDTMSGFAIGTCIMVGGGTIGSISGAPLNPAINFGVALAHHGAEGSIFAAIFYSGVQLLGGVCAAQAFRETHPDDFVEEEPQADMGRRVSRLLSGNMFNRPSQS